MTARSKTGSFAEDLAKTPGPGHYRILDPNVVKRRGPAYSILGRSYMPGGRFNLKSYYTYVKHHACIMFVNSFRLRNERIIHNVRL